MSNAPGSRESNSGLVPSNVENGGLWTEERLAAILLRVLGVFFLASGVISVAEEAVRLVLALNVRRAGLYDVLPRHWTYLAYLAAELGVGIYLLIGGRWVFEKVLRPVVPDPSDSEDAGVDQALPDERTGPADAPGNQP